MEKVESASILDMAMGAIKERVDYEMGHVIIIWFVTSPHPLIHILFVALFE